MGPITDQTSLEELAAIVSQALEEAGVVATLSGGAAVSLYTANDYESHDLDFVSSAEIETIARAIAPLGFSRSGATRYFGHQNTEWFVEFPPGPLAFGDMLVRDEELPVLETPHGPLRVITPTQVVMDRVAAYAHWSDGQSLDQARMIARRQDVQWSELRRWAEREGIERSLIDQLERSAID
jgi:hypothetical protein